MEPTHLIIDDDIIWDPPEGAPIGRVPRRQGRDPEWYQNYEAYRNWTWRDYEFIVIMYIVFPVVLYFLGWGLLLLIQWVFVAIVRIVDG